MPRHPNPRDFESRRDRDHEWSRSERYQTSPHQDRFTPGNERRYQADRSERSQHGHYERGPESSRYAERNERRAYEGDRRYGLGGYPEEFGHRHEQTGSQLHRHDPRRRRDDEFRGSSSHEDSGQQWWGQGRDQHQSGWPRPEPSASQDEHRDEKRGGWLRRLPRSEEWHEGRRRGAELQGDHRHVSARYVRSEDQDWREDDWRGHEASGGYGRDEDDWRSHEASSQYIRGQDDWRSREASSRYIRGGFRGQREHDPGYGDFDRSRWTSDIASHSVAENTGPAYYGTGRHYGGGYGTAPGTRASEELGGEWLREHTQPGDEGYGVPAYGRRATYLGDLRSSREGGRYASEGRHGAQHRHDEGPWSDEPHYEPPRSHRGRGPRGYQRSDERLKELICERLTDDPRIDASDISIDVSQGVVRLSGKVQDRRTKYEVEDLIEHCGGVKDIDNQLRVRARNGPPGSKASDDPEMAHRASEQSAGRLSGNLSGHATSQATAPPSGRSPSSENKASSETPNLGQPSQSAGQSAQSSTSRVSGQAATPKTDVDPSGRRT